MKVYGADGITPITLTTVGHFLSTLPSKQCYIRDYDINCSEKKAKVRFIPIDGIYKTFSINYELVEKLKGEGILSPNLKCTPNNNYTVYTCPQHSEYLTLIYVSKCKYTIERIFINLELSQQLEALDIILAILQEYHYLGFFISQFKEKNESNTLEDNASIASSVNTLSLTNDIDQIKQLLDNPIKKEKTIDILFKALPYNGGEMEKEILTVLIEQFLMKGKSYKQLSSNEKTELSNKLKAATKNDTQYISTIKYNLNLSADYLEKEEHIEKQQTQALGNLFNNLFNNLLDNSNNLNITDVLQCLFNNDIESSYVHNIKDKISTKNSIKAIEILQDKLQPYIKGNIEISNLIKQIQENLAAVPTNETENVERYSLVLKSLVEISKINGDEIYSTFGKDFLTEFFKQIPMIMDKSQQSIILYALINNFFKDKLTISEGKTQLSTEFADILSKDEEFIKIINHGLNE